jgi:folate-binding protein YgfZ
MTVTSPQDDLVVYDVSDRTQIEITGADRATFLHGFCTNDIKSLRPGQGCEALLTNIKGRVLAHVYVFAGAESLWLETFPGQESAIISHLDRYLIREDVQLIGRTAERGELLVTGNLAAPLLMLDQGLAPCGSVTRDALGSPLEIRRVDLLGVPGYLLSVVRTAVESTRLSLQAVGCRAGSPEEFETRRIHAGFPRYGQDITEENLAQEVARTPQCISFKKGCYLGQEPIARLDAMGHTNRELRRIQFDASAHPQPGAIMLSAESDQEAGNVTSVAPCPDPLGAVIALGYLKTNFSRPETRVRINSDPPIVGIVQAVGSSG